MNHSKSLVLSLLAAAAPTAVAQDLVIPSSHAASEGQGGVMVAGLGTAGRQQILVDASHLAGVQGRILHSLALRRDAGSGSIMGGADVDLVVRLAPAARAVDAPSTRFAANLGAGAVEVFRGRIHVPQSDSPSSGLVPWAAPYTVEIPFQAGYAYGGGDLVVDVEGTPVGVSDFHWVADLSSSDAAGTARLIGYGCGPFAPSTGTNAGVAARELVPGQVATFSMFGQPGALAILGIGLAPRSRTLDLTPFGAPGCGLFVDPIMTASTLVSAPLHSSMAAGAAQLEVPLPADATLFGARFATQWFEFGSTLHTYHGFDCTMATGPGALGVSTVHQDQGDSVDVSLNSAPALRFGVR